MRNPLKNRPLLSPKWRDPLWRRYAICREIVVLLGLFEYIGLGGFLFFLGASDARKSVVSLALMGGSYYISTKLAWYTNELLVRLATKTDRAVRAPKTDVPRRPA